VEYGVQDGYLDEFAYPFDGIVKPLVRLAKHPHLVAFRDHIPDEQYSNYGCSIERDLNEKGNVPENFARCVHVSPFAVIWLKTDLLYHFLFSVPSAF
jgi:hypothetical protein